MRAPLLLALVADAYDAGPGERLGRIGGRAAAAAEPGDAVLGGDELGNLPPADSRSPENRVTPLGRTETISTPPPGKSIHPRAPERQSILGGEIRNLETQRSIGRELAHETADVESKTELSGGHAVSQEGSCRSGRHRRARSLSRRPPAPSMARRPLPVLPPPGRVAPSHRTSLCLRARSNTPCRSRGRCRDSDSGHRRLMIPGPGSLAP